MYAPLLLSLSSKMDLDLVWFGLATPFLEFGSYLFSKTHALCEVCEYSRAPIIRGVDYLWCQIVSNM
jgi:hypothetical protein